MKTVLVFQEINAHNRPAVPPTQLGVLSGVLRARGCEHAVIDLQTGHTPQHRSYNNLLKYKFSRLFFLKYNLNSYIPQIALGWAKPFDVLCRVAEHFLHAVLAEQARIILSAQPDIVAFSLYNWNWMNTLLLIRLLKENRGNLIVVVGGQQATFLGRKLFEYSPGIDYVVLGEGEERLPEVIDAAGEKRAPRGDGILYRTEQGIAGEDSYTLLADLDRLPLPDYSWADRAAYLMPDYLPIVSSRGCPARCAFCEERTFWQGKYRERSAESVVAEMARDLQEYNVSKFDFAESLINANPARMRKMCELILAAKMPVEWKGMARISTMTPELLALMAEAGCSELFYGLESINDGMLVQMGKGTNAGQIREVLGWTRAAGIAAHGFFIIGFPNETVAAMEETLHFAVAAKREGLLANSYVFGFSMLAPFISEFTANKDSYGVEVRQQAPEEFYGSLKLKELDRHRGVWETTYPGAVMWLEASKHAPWRIIRDLATRARQEIERTPAVPLAAKPKLPPA